MLLGDGAGPPEQRRLLAVPTAGQDEDARPVRNGCAAADDQRGGEKKRLAHCGGVPALGGGDAGTRFQPAGHSLTNG